MKRKIIIILPVLFALMIIVVCIAIIKKPKTIEEISGVNFNDIAYIKTGGALNHNYDFEVEKFIKEYKNKKYRKFTGDRGGTAHIYYICYDEDNNIILTIVEIGNRNLVFIKKGTFNINNDSNKIYQLVE